MLLEYLDYLKEISESDVSSDVVIEKLTSN